MRCALLLEVEADLADGHDTRILRKPAQDLDVRWRCLSRVVADPGPDFAVPAGERDRNTAACRVDAHRHHPRHARLHRRAHHSRRVTQLLQVEVGVYEDASCSSSSTTSSRRLKSACGCGSGWPGASSDGRQRSALEYSPVKTLWRLPPSDTSRTWGCGAMTSV